MKPEIPPADTAAPTHEFTQLFSSTPRGARLARLMAVQQLDSWGWSYGSGVSQTVALLVAELAANAATHAVLPGQDFRLRLATGPGLLLSGTLRIEAADALGERRPHVTAPLRFPSPDSETGRGLPLIASLATRWGVRDQLPSAKVVWAELDLSACVSPHG